MSSLWPDPPLVDDFNRANSNPLSGYWTQRVSYLPLELNANSVRLPDTTGPCEMYWSLQQYGPSCAGAIVLAGWNTSGGQGAQWNLELCCSGVNLADSYAVEFTVLYDGSPAAVGVRRRGSWFQPGVLTGLPSVVAVGDQLGLYINGRSVEVWFRHGAADWKLIQAFDDATLSGLPPLPAGFAAIGGNEAGGLSLAQQVRLDGFRVSNPFSLPLRDAEVWGIGDGVVAGDYSTKVLGIPGLQAYYKFDAPYNVMEFPSVVSDDFNRADENPAVASVWEPRNNRPMQVVGNAMVAAAATGAKSYGIYLPGGIMTKQEAYATIGFGGSTYPGAYAGVLARMQPGLPGDVPRGYSTEMWVGMTAASGGSYGYLCQRLGSPNVTLGGGTSSPPNTFPGDKIGLQVDGNAITTYIYRQATGRWSYHYRFQDNTYASGYAGVLADPTVTLEDFGCGPLQFDTSSVWPFPSTSGVAYTKQDFIRDYSGNNRHLSAQQSASVSYGANPPTFVKKPGAVSPDTGCVQFNIGYFIWTGPFSSNQIGLIAPFSPGEYVSNVSNLGVSISFFIMFIPTAPPDSWAPYSASEPPEVPFVSSRYRDFGGTTNEGFCFWVNPYTGTLRYTVATNQGFPSGSWPVGTLVPNVWSHVFVRVEPISLVAPKTWRRTIYLNEAVVYDNTGDFNTIAPIPGGGSSLSFGGGWGDDLRWNVVRGGVDEFAIWNRPLSDAERKSLYDRKVTSWGGTG